MRHILLVIVKFYDTHIYPGIHLKKKKKKLLYFSHTVINSSSHTFKCITIEIKMFKLLAK